MVTVYNTMPCDYHCNSSLEPSAICSMLSSRMSFPNLDDRLVKKLEALPGARVLANTMVFDHIVPVQMTNHTIYRFFHHGGGEWHFVVFGVVQDTNAGSFVKATGCTNVSFLTAYLHI